MRKKLDESMKRVPVQIMVYPYIKQLLEEEAAKLDRGSISVVGESLITAGLGIKVRRNGKKVSNGRKG